jgi:glucokinase
MQGMAGMTGMPSSPTAPTAPLRPSGGTASVLAIDIGGTKLAVARVDEAGRVHETAQAPTRGHDADALFASLVALVREVSAAADRVGVGFVACGVGCGGPMSRGGETVSPLNIPQWRDFPLAARLAEVTGVPVVVDHDAKGLALGE